ncbi:MAG: MoaD/ThiS family protein [Methanotrichaceae archaeon]|nr:MoaD/ThiS family protein [Methanotrichaceae archaeon]
MGQGSTYEDFLAAQDINPETVVVLRDGDPVPLDDEIEDGEISIIRVVSSG